MSFGIGDLLSIFAGAGFLANKAAKEHKEKQQALTRNDLIQRFVQKYTDPVLEEKLRQDILDPAKYDEIWERIESYKARNGGWYSWRRDHPAWQAVSQERLPFRTESGAVHAKNQYEDSVLSDNRNKALFMLMHTYGKMTVNDATLEARWATDGMLQNWIVKHPAEY